MRPLTCIDFRRLYICVLLSLISPFQVSEGTQTEGMFHGYMGLGQECVDDGQMWTEVSSLPSDDERAQQLRITKVENIEQVCFI